MLKASINLIKDLKKQKRENSSLLFLDNVKIITDAISGGIQPKIILVEKESLNKWGNICPVYLVDKKTIEQLSDCKTPQGVLCIAEYIQDIEMSTPNTNFLVIDGLQDPGNVGTLIRTATACGFKKIFLIESVNPTNSKVVRSSVGTIFKSKIISLSRKDFIDFASKNNLYLLKADMKGENLFETKFNQIVGVVVGNEGQGVSKEISEICKKSISIPMERGVESLNVAISGAIIMYQIYSKSFKI